MSNTISNTSSSPNADIAPQPRPNRRLHPALMVLIMAVPIVIILGLGLALVESDRRSITNGPAPDFELITYTGEALKLSQHRGTIVVLNFWASWCGPCRSEAADLNAIWDEYRDRGVVMIGVGWLDNLENAKQFLAEFGVDYQTGHDAGSKIAERYGVKQVPETFVIDRAGNIVYQVPGPTTAADLRVVLDRLLQ